MKSMRLLALCLSLCPLWGQQLPAPIIDMHMHANSLGDFGEAAPIRHCRPMTAHGTPLTGRDWMHTFRSHEVDCEATWSPATDEEVRAKTFEIMDQRNILGVVSGRLAEQWAEMRPERFIVARAMRDPASTPITALREAFESGRFRVFGEVTVQYLGIAPGDAVMSPYWEVAEHLDIPVGIHMGPGAVGAPYMPQMDRYRAGLSSPLLLEDVLVRHPGLRVYINHAGWPKLDDLLALLWTHPQVRVEVGAIAWAIPRVEFHRYLRRIVEAGFGDRVLFGSDQMAWPETIEISIDSIESAPFLTHQQKRDILFNNAARFLRLTEAEIASIRPGEKQ